MQWLGELIERLDWIGGVVVVGGGCGLWVVGCGIVGVRGVGTNDFGKLGKWGRSES